jgi:hypothetical protein
MAKYVINDRVGQRFEVEADQFMTVGDFVDFSNYADADLDVVFRIKASQVFTVEMVK